MFENPSPCIISDANEAVASPFREMEKKQQEQSDFELAKSLQVLLF